MPALLDQLMQSPRLAMYMEQLEHRLRDERRLRQHFYAMLNEDTKAEFINGEVIYHSPNKYEHTHATGLIYRLLSACVDANRSGHVGMEKMLVTLTRNDYEPDVAYFSSEKARTFKQGQMHFPAPDLIVEVLSESTEKIDRGVKFEDYAAHGVAEYWIIDPIAQVVEQYVIDGDAYTLVIKANTGVIRSRAITGFEAPVRAFFDPQENLKALAELVG